VETAVSVAVLGGVTVSALRPDYVSRLATLDGLGASHPTIATSGLVMAISVIICRLYVLWGPVRTDSATARWRLSGPSSRNTDLRRPFAITTLTGTGAITLACLLAATLHPRSLPALLVVGLACAAATIGIAYNAQLHRSHTLTGRAGWALNSLPRRVFSPNDGLAASAALALSTMDVSWLRHARIVRWQQKTTGARARSTLPSSSVLALLALEVRRAYRSPTAAGRVAISVLTSAAAATLLEVHVSGLFVAAALAYCSGNSMSSGLSQIYETPALSRALGLGNRYLIACHSVIPGVAVLCLCVVNASLWHTNTMQTAALCVGATVAVVLRNTSTGLPHHAMTFTDPFFGVTLQPALLTNILKGPLAVAVAAALAMNL
jgi:hypothetical protein